MASARTQHRRAATLQTGRVHRQAQPGRRFTRSAPASTRGRLPRRRRQPETGRAEKLLELVRGALPGGGSRAKGKGSAIPVVGGLLGGRRGLSAGRGRKSALLGLLGAGAAGAAVAAKRRKSSDSGRPSEPDPLPEPRTATTPPSTTDDPAPGSAD
jgi:hypothetical protein